MVDRSLLRLVADEVKASFASILAESSPALEVTAVFEVCNGAYSSIYDVLKGTMQEQTGEPPLELELWHGTLWSCVPKILRHGFNRSFAGRHGTLLGTATYFSTDPSYSRRFCDRRGGARGATTQALLLSRVLVGKYCKGAASDVEPPICNVETGERYDSTVDNKDRPSIFAVFRDFQAVPLFLVEVKA